MNENIYEGGDKYAEECKKVYLDDEKNIGNGKTKILYKKWKENNEDIDIYEKVIPGYKDVLQTQLITSKGKSQKPFPRELPQKCIDVFSSEGDLILDPFAGSGTTGFVATEMKRNYIGIEIPMQIGMSIVNVAV